MNQPPLRGAHEAIMEARADPGHLTAFEHYRAAERALAKATTGYENGDAVIVGGFWHARAQVHATLAAAAGAFLNDHQQGVAGAELAVWRQTCEADSNKTRRFPTP